MKKINQVIKFVDYLLLEKSNSYQLAGYCSNLIYNFNIENIY